MPFFTLKAFLKKEKVIDLTLQFNVLIKDVFAPEGNVTAYLL